GSRTTLRFAPDRGKHADGDPQRYRARLVGASALHRVPTDRHTATRSQECESHGQSGGARERAVGGVVSSAGGWLSAALPDGTLGGGGATHRGAGAHGHEGTGEPARQHQCTSQSLVCAGQGWQPRQRGWFGVVWGTRVERELAAQRGANYTTASACYR